MSRSLIAALVACNLVAVALAGTHEAGLKWLAQKKTEEGVIALPSGLMCKVLNKGSGLFHPTVDSPCDAQYTGSLIDGTEFISSYRPFAPNQVIKGWTEAMQLMVEGDKWEIYIPSELAYVDQDKGAIKAGDPLVFTMEILGIRGDKVPASRCDAKTVEGCDEL